MADPLSAPLGTRHPFTSSIIAAFAATKPGDTLSDEQISKACGATRDRWSALMSTVAKALLKEHGVAIERVTNVGYRHLPDAEIPATSKRAVDHIRRTAKRAANRLVYGVKNYAGLAPQAQVELNTRIAQVGTLHHIATAHAEKEIRAAVEVQNNKIEIGSTLKLLAGK